MLFTTLHWAIFLLTVFVLYHLVAAPVRKWLMLAASIYFYASWSAPYLLLIGSQLLVDWSCGWMLGRTRDERRRKGILAASIIANLGVLCVFKYWGLLSRTLAEVGIHLPEV